MRPRKQLDTHVYVFDRSVDKKQPKSFDFHGSNGVKYRDSTNNNSNSNSNNNNSDNNNNNNNNTNNTNNKNSNNNSNNNSSNNNNNNNNTLNDGLRSVYYQLDATILKLCEKTIALHVHHCRFYIFAGLDVVCMCVYVCVCVCMCVCVCVLRVLMMTYR